VLSYACSDDYVLEFEPRDQLQVVELKVIGDAVAEDDETFSVALSDPVNATIEVPAALVVIANDGQAFREEALGQALIRLW
jgi:hypothetical protein